MTVPQSFDYLRAGPRLEEIASLWRVAKPLRASCRALGLSCLFVISSWSFETARLHRAAAAEEANAQLYSRQQSILKAARVRENQVKLVVDTDDRIRAIAESGAIAARRLAALSADLPANVWITAITPDSAGMTLNGRTVDLSGLSKALMRLNADPLLEKPFLTSAQLTPAPAPPAAALRFTLHFGHTGR